MRAKMKKTARVVVAGWAACGMVVWTAGCGQTLGDGITLPAIGAAPRTLENLPAPVGKPIAPRLANLGKLHYPVSTPSPQAQAFFNQGLRLNYAFNHAESVRSFREAARLDPSLAMAYWGVALSLGPNINEAMPDERGIEAYAAIQTAISLKSFANEKERGLIDALALRYASEHVNDRKPQDWSYAHAMGALVKRYPNDPDIGTLYADALMNTGPWDYWRNGTTPKPHGAKALEVLNRVVAAHPDHPGAHHFFIHLVEASDTPERAIQSAERLGELMPGAGHIVHMPSHIFVRVGRYADAIAANQKAIAVDEDYVTQCHAQGLYPAEYYPHNVHFLWSAAQMAGASKIALASARKIAEQASHGHMKVFLNMQDLSAIPYYALARFGLYKELLAEPRPSGGEYQLAMWHYGQGIALARTGKASSAKRHLTELRARINHPSLADMHVGFDSAAVPLTIAAHVLAGEIAAARRDFDTAIAELEAGALLQDGLAYNEPATFYFPVRHVLGAVLLQTNRPAEAEAVYLESLRKNRENGWSLFGLERALRDQRKTAEAQRVHDRFERAWRSADVRLKGSRF